jgi:DNA-binding NarL/FixJ family response regulator
MVAEGIAAALSRYPEIVPVGVVTTAAEGLDRGGRAFAVAMDHRLPGAGRAAEHLRRAGVRVVFLGGLGDGEEVRVPLTAPVSALATALVPGLPNRDPRGDGLSYREREVLGLVGRGLAAKEIARQLGISVKTVERHKSRIFTKLGVPNQAAAAFFAATNGISTNGGTTIAGANGTRKVDAWNHSTI